MKKLLTVLKEKQKLFLNLSELARKGGDLNLANELMKQSLSFKEEAWRLTNEAI